MNISYIGLSIALDQENESGTEIIYRFIEKLRLSQDAKKMTKQLEREVDKIDKFLIDNNSTLGDSSYFEKKINLLLTNLGKALLEEDIDKFDKNSWRFRNVINFLYAINEVALNTFGVIDTEAIDFNFSNFDCAHRIYRAAEYRHITSRIESILDTKPQDLDKIIIDITTQSAFLTRIRNYFQDFDLNILDGKDFTHFDLRLTNDLNLELKIRTPYPIIHESAKEEILKQRENDLSFMMDISTNTASMQKFGFLLWSLGSSLENIKGVTTTITDIRMGSVWAKVKIDFADIISKEETKTVLSNALKIVINSSNKLNESLLNTERGETAIVKDSTTQNFDSPAQKQLDSLAIESKLLDNRKKLAEIESQELDNRLKQAKLIDVYSQLAARGILSIDDLQININDGFSLIKKGNDITASDFDGMQPPI